MRGLVLFQDKEASMGSHLLDENQNTRADLVRRAADDSRDLLDQAQIQGGSQVVLGDRTGTSYCELIRDTSADNHMGMSIGARGILTSDLEIGKERVEHFQSSETSAVKKRTVEEHDGRLQEGEDSASL
ncbi:hypothetical protein Dimus_023227 [Dionaea muscipula]